MKVINGKNYYTINEILDKINERCGTKMKKGNTILQWFRRHRFPKFVDYSYGNIHYYDEDIANEIIDYHARKTKIKKAKQECNLKTKDLLGINRKFTKKYKKW